MPLHEFVFPTLHPMTVFGFPSTSRCFEDPLIPSVSLPYWAPGAIVDFHEFFSVLQMFLYIGPSYCLLLLSVFLTGNL